MSMFENPAFRWRETYFVLFKSTDRPSLKKVEHALTKLDARYELVSPLADEDDHFESVTLISPDDYAALDICYTEGDDVFDQVQQLREEIRPADLSPAARADFGRLGLCNARFDVLHFEQVADDAEEEEEMLDPGSLLLVLGALAKICHGVAIDPQAGTILEDDA
jgi:hypothetical protein